MKYTYEIVTDTAADIPWNAVSQDHIAVVPMPMTLDGKPFEYNGVIHPADAGHYYRQLHEGAASMTAQVQPAAYRRAFEQAFDRNHDVLYIGFSSGMSGSYPNAVATAAAMNAEHPSRRVVCVDSRLATVAQTMLLLIAIANRRQGMALSQNADYLMEARQKIRVFFVVEDMNFLLRGGRITKSQAILSQALHIRPILRINELGTLVTVEKVRGAGRALRALVDQVGKPRDDTAPLFFIGHCDAPAEADNLVQTIKRRYADAGIQTFLTNPVIGCHTGPQMLTLAGCDQTLADQIRFVLAGANQ